MENKKNSDFRPEKKIPLATPTMHEEEMGFIREAFERNWIAPLGFNCDGLEEEIAQYLATGEIVPVGSSPYHTLSLASGTAALHLAVKLAGIGRGDIVLCSDMTFSATVNPISYEGALQVFVDSEYDTWNMDPEALKIAFEKYPKAKAVMLAHLYGTPAKIDEIRKICDEHGAVLIEDAAESLASTYKGRQTGTFGDVAAISFNGNKIITTSGGGMLITKEKAARDKAFFWATQSREQAPWYQHREIGYNYRMSNVCAGIGRGQLRHLEEHRAAKEAIYERYRVGFAKAGAPLSMNPYLEDTHPNFWLSCLLLDEDAGLSPMELHRFLAERDIETRPIWKPMHLQPVFAENDFITTPQRTPIRDAAHLISGPESDFARSAGGNKRPVDEDIFARGLCLPSDIKMTEEEQDYVIDCICEALR